MLALEDMKTLSEKQVKDHIADQFAGAEMQEYGTDEEKAALRKTLNGFAVLVAYESVGSWGCDSSAWFLLRKKSDKTLHTISGSHCSCYGFEGQGEIEATDIAYLKSDKFYLPLGGYDDAPEANKEAVLKYIRGLK
jgi:hypothetical protein